MKEINQVFCACGLLYFAYLHFILFYKKHLKKLFLLFHFSEFANMNSRALSRISRLTLQQKHQTRCLSFEFTDQQKEFQKAAIQFSKDVIVPQAAKYDKSGEFPWDIVKQAHEMGFMNSQIPEKYGILF